MGDIFRLKFYARIRKGYKEPLCDHLSQVSDRAARFISTAPISEAKRLSRLTRVMGLTHDFGKYTSFFQSYLLTRQPNDTRSHHSFISALLYAYIAQQRYPQDEEGMVLGFLAIARHHLQLINPQLTLLSSSEKVSWPELLNLDKSGLRTELLACREQFKDLTQMPRYSKVLSEQKLLGLPEVESFLKNVDVLPKLLNDMFKILRKWRNSDEASFSRRYWHTLLLFSALIDADKHASAATSTVSRIKEHNSLIKAVDDYVASKSRGTGTMQNIRDALRQAALRASEHPLNELYPAALSVTAPTGSGKTLAVMAFATRLRKRIANEKGVAPRIIYALPFVNIIEQNYNVIEEALLQLPEYAKNPSGFLLKHHYLTDLAYQKGDEKKSLDEALLLTDSWESEIIVSTFVQLFHTLVGYQNKALKKIHNIAGSIIILDEIQSVPFEYWHLIRFILSTLTGELGCTVLLMTATQPRILPYAKSLVSDEVKDQMFSNLDRTQIEPNLNPITVKEFAKNIAETHDLKQSLLIVVNTIRTAVELYQELKKIQFKEREIKLKGFHELLDEKDFDNNDWSSQPFLVHLSTNITPWQRRKRIEFLNQTLKSDKGNVKPIVISTQVIEAGVDLDFDLVIRDLGPLDSIVQVAGRCNRNGLLGTQKVRIVNLIRENSKKSDARLVYGEILPQETERLLTKSFSENEIYSLVEMYFEGVENRGSQKKSKDLLKAIKNLNFYDSSLINSKGLDTISKFRLIDETNSEPVFIELNPRAKRLKRLLETSLYHLKRLPFNDPKQGKLRFKVKSLFRRLGAFTITPTWHRLSKNLPPGNKIFEEYFYVTYGDVIAKYPAYYDMETGFKWESETLIF